MDNKIFAPLMKAGDGQSHLIDINAFITRYLLFDHYTIDSQLMRDIAQLIDVFGIEGLEELLQSGDISIHTSAQTIGQMNHHIEGEPYPRPAFWKDSQQYILPYNHFYPTFVDITDRREYIGHGFSSINKLGYPGKRTRKLKSIILDHLTEVPDSHISYTWMERALSGNEPVVRRALLNVLEAKSIKSESIDSLEFSFKCQGGIISVESNLQQIANTDEYIEHTIMEQVMLGLGGFYKRLSLMKSYDSIAWFSDEDSRLLEAEMDRVAINQNSDTQEQRLSRIIELKGLPHLGTIKTLNAHTLMRLRDTSECREFRDWLRTSDAKSDEDIKHEINRLSTAFGNMFGSFQTRVARFAITTSLGSMISVNPLVGVAVGAADQFILDKLIKRNGPIWFINNELPKLSDLYRQ